MTSIADAWTAPARSVVTELLRLRGQSIILTPATGTVVEKPGGGKDYTAGTPRSAQTFALFKTDSLDGREKAQTDQGLSRKFDYKLIGYFDAAIAIGDTWSDETADYTVESVDRSKPYQITALVTGFLKVTGHGYG